MRRIPLRLFVRMHDHDLPRRFLGKFKRNFKLDSSLCSGPEKVWEYRLHALKSGGINQQKMRNDPPGELPIIPSALFYKHPYRSGILPVSQACCKRGLGSNTSAGRCESSKTLWNIYRNGNHCANVIDSLSSDPSRLTNEVTVKMIQSVYIPRIRGN